ncbi:S8 family serine peptidase [Streptomyces sp. NPDC094448]|uniref:S8 family serine peptidase n=1 Tax=Streptomyces sp. NPDC094448 TaxID=3366063 RepID=UPI00380BC146
MRKPAKRAYAAAACAVALAAGTTGPASAAGGDRGAVPPSAVTKSKGGAGTGQTVTLITGDRVTVDARGRVGGIERAKGREDIPFFTQSHQGRTYAVPRDARRLIADGTLDRQLFDVTALAKPEIRKAHGAGLKVIVGYRGTAAKAARDEVRAADGTTVHRTLSMLDADAVTSAEGSTGALWEALSRPRGDGSAALASGVARVWLDGVRKAKLDRSTAQIGSPAAWSRSYDGTGVRIAVVDTGIDSTHPDLAGRVVAEKNFSGSPDATDRSGHGTHVASIAAGSGAKDSRFKGVAPGAQLINAKVLDDRGEGLDSGILAGVDWAVAQGADVVNMSLGSPDTPGIDPLEAQINKLSAEKGVLFAVAAGNEGPDAGTLGTPGTADAALTVGAVDDNDLMADFSSAGPRTGDGAVKPDVTAPGVAITAAAAAGTGGQNPPGYTAQNGTSMASPHVAGAAAILKQKNPTWTGAQLKSVLVASAKDGAHAVFRQGAGRIQVDRAIDQTVVAEPVSLDLGTQLWPHHDDTPVTKKLTYRNYGTADVTLDLAATAATGADGLPAPAGFFTLGAQRVTVPAGGTAAVDVTADTRLGGTVEGLYSVTVVASGDGRTVRTAATVDREIESYEVTFNSFGRDGAPGTDWLAELRGYGGAATGRRVLPDLTAGSDTVRMPRGTYILSADMLVDPAAPRKGADLIDNPQFTVDGPTTVTLDARTTRPVSFTMPDPAARSVRAGMMYTYLAGGSFFIQGGEFTGFDNVRTAYQGPQQVDGALEQTWSTDWERGTDEYHTLSGGPVAQLATGYTKSYAAGDLALVKTAIGASAPGARGALALTGGLPSGAGVETPFFIKPASQTRNVHLSTGDGAVWQLVAGIPGVPSPEGYPRFDVLYANEPRQYSAGGTYTENFNTGVPGPRVDARAGIVRTGNDLSGSLPLTSDDAGHDGYARYASASTTIHRDGVLYAQDDTALGARDFALPPEPARYTVATTVHRDPAFNRAGTRIDASWTFTSARTDAATALPVSTVRFRPDTALDSTVPAGGKQIVPVVVQGAAAGAGLKSLRVAVSYDGKKWLPAPVAGGKVTVRAPEKGKAISLKAVVTDRQDNQSAVTVHNAFFGR